MRSAIIWVRIMAIIAWLGASFVISLGAIMLLMFAYFGFAKDVTSAAIMAFFVLLWGGFALMYGCLGWGLWTYQNSARIVAIILTYIAAFCCLAVMVVILLPIPELELTPFDIVYSELRMLLSLALCAVQIWLLQFDPAVKGLFGKPISKSAK